MKSIYNIVDEAKQDEKSFMVVGDDETIQSVWPNKNDADDECEKCNKEIGGKYFSVKSCNKSEIMN